MKANLMGNRVIIFNPEEGSRLYKEGFYGKPVGIRKPKTFEFDRPLELSLIETLYLLETERIVILDQENSKLIGNDEFRSVAEQYHKNFLNKYLVYKDLRKKGYVVRPGLKFGADFAVYIHGPGIDHAPFIIHVLESRDNISAIEMVRAGRLATSVRKKFVIATVPLTNQISYYIFTWFKP
ncbi:MAG: tRNA-intron lyase [Candidatus Lokiarchaeota archaeon]|nr:tRNA-intron lyase [Candidatus Lokiarchaeota archaeon]